MKESTLRRTGGSTGGAVGGAGAEDTAAAEPAVPVRRLEVRVEEFCQSSEFSDGMVATTLLKVPADWLTTGLLIHPCMRIPGVWLPACSLCVLGAVTHSLFCRP